ncbi:hypothetical protein [Oricola sp.]|uniref:hypothetical protein n=1 Tax=Oricola sp. TaxID=1979950 RepID=UPI003BAD8811
MFAEEEVDYTGSLTRVDAVRASGTKVSATESVTPGADPLEKGIALEMEREFDSASDAGDDRLDSMTKAESGRLLDMQRKRALCEEIEQQIQQGSGLMGTLTKQIGILSTYLEKAESDLKKLEKVEISANKLRAASDGLVRKNHEMKSQVEEQKKRIALLEAKTNALRETNEQARTSMARLLEEKRIATVETAELQSEIARLETDRSTLTDKLDILESDVSDLNANLDKVREKEQAAVSDNRRKEDELSRLREEVGDLRELRKQNTIELEDFKSKNATLESKVVEQKSRIDELNFELDSGRKEFEEIVRLKQQRILELEARAEEKAYARREVSETETPPIAYEPMKPALKPATFASIKAPEGEATISEAEKALSDV